MLEYRSIIGKNGRLVIPSPIRKKLSLNQGEEIIIREDEEGRVYFYSLNNAITNAQRLVKQCNPNNVKLTDMLYKLRKEEANA